MANLTKDRNTLSLASTRTRGLTGPYGLAANAKTYKGVMFSLDANGRVKDPANGDNKVMGVHRLSLDNTGGANDALKAEGYRGPHCFDAHGVHPPTVADIGKKGYASDNHTISNTAADGCDAGIITNVDASGVWIDVDPIA